MQTLDDFFGQIIEAGIKESRWFRTAPPKFQEAATIRVLGIDERKFFGFGTAQHRPALIAECTCGGETQRFSLLLDNTEHVEPID